jgi:hypothetical protein
MSTRSLQGRNVDLSQPTEPPKISILTSVTLNDREYVVREPRLKAAFEQMKLCDIAIMHPLWSDEQEIPCEG